MTPFEILTLANGSGIKIAFLDSGVPDTPSYSTIFIFHGLCFNARVYQKVIDLARSSSIRIVAINRRDYAPSTPLTPDDVSRIIGTDEQKSRYLSDRGIEVLQFVDQFIQQHNLPEISDDGKSGGSALLGWSLGASFVLAALAHVSSLTSDAQSRLSKHIRSLILEDPPTLALGKPWPQGGWLPGLNCSIPRNEVTPFTNQWLTSYFDHPGDLSLRDPTALSSVVPSSNKVPSIFSMPYSLVTDESAVSVNGSETLHVAGNLAAQLHECYERVLFGQETREAFPYLRIWELARAQSIVLTISAAWEIQKDDEERGGGYVNCRIIPGTNHFVHWDYPQRAIDAWKMAMA